MEKLARVLVVEDDQGAREAIRELLKPYYDVVTVGSGAAAIELLRRMSVDVVTLEPWLPGLQGREILNRIRAVRPDLRVIIVTGHPLSLWFDDTVREEVFDYLPKPFESRQLLRSLRKALVSRVPAYAAALRSAV